MLQIKDKIREDFKIDSRGKKFKVFIYECKDCKKELYIYPTRFFTKTGYCYHCSRKQATKIVQTEGLKTCSKCLKNLELNKFSKTGRSITNNTWCIRCFNLAKFNMTSLDYDILYNKQDGKCAICKNPETAIDKRTDNIIDLAVDHCHSTGKVRGLLCGKCNRAIGLLNDSIENLQKAINYLKSFNETSI